MELEDLLVRKWRYCESAEARDIFFHTDYNRKGWISWPEMERALNAGAKERLQRRPSWASKFEGLEVAV